MSARLTRNVSMSPEQRLSNALSRTVLDGDCWIWQGAVINTGYGSLRGNDARSVLLHRFVYEATVGPIPEGMTIDHLCRRKRCCNPAHLEAVSLADNIRRVPKPETCKRGHPRIPENIYRWPKTGNIKGCRPCNVERKREREARARALMAARDVTGHVE